MAEKRKKQRGLLDIVPEAAPEAAAVSGGWLDPASYDPSMLSYRAGTGLRNMMAGTAALPGLLGEVGRGALQKIRELSPEDLRGRAAPQDTTVVDAASALARRVAQDPGAAASKVLDYGRGVLSSPGNVVEFLGENITPRPRGPRPVMQEIDVYHGSPHRFEEFDASKIGTGEGAQAYGHGIYLAESPDVAKVYRSATDPVARRAEMTLQMTQGNVDEAIKFVKKDAKRYETYKNESFFKPEAYQEKLNELEYLKQIKKGKSPQVGAFYKADLPDKMVDRMLDWDKRISDQPEFVQKAWADWRATPQAQKLVKQMTARGSSAQDIEKMFANPTGETMHKWIYEGYGSAKGGEMPKVASFLKDKGLLGVKYQDAGSRGQGGTGTRNFVVFPGEEKNVKILKRE